MMKRKKITALFLAAVLCLTLGACKKAGQKDATSEKAGEAASAGAQSSISQPSSGQKASFAHFTATNLEGETVDETIFAANKLTMINIWATYCAPCLREMPELGELAQAYSKHDVGVVGIVLDTLQRDGTPDEKQVALAKEIVEKTKADYMHLLPSQDLIEARLGEVTGVPETIFVDNAGNLVGKSYLGARSKGEWSSIVDELLKTVQ